MRLQEKRGEPGDMRRGHAGSGHGDPERDAVGLARLHEQAALGQRRLNLVTRRRDVGLGSTVARWTLRAEERRGLSARDLVIGAHADRVPATGQGLSDPDLIAAITVMLGLADDHAKLEAARNPRRHRRRLIEGVLRLMAARARRDKLLAVIEDAHWADDSTLMLVRTCLNHSGCAPILLVVTSRHSVLEEVEPALRLRLDRLTEEESRSLVQNITGGALTPETVTEIVGRTDGIPLFIEEVTWTAVYHDGQVPANRQGGGVDIPMSLGHSLAARLDQLAGVRRVVQAASVLGRVFRADILAEIAADGSLGADISLQTALEHLQTTRFIETVPGGAEGSFRFRHALIQEAAYSSILREPRRRQHRRIAGLLRSRGEDRFSTPPETIAWHYAAGGCPGEAIQFYRDAARQAAQLAADVEAVQHYRSALSSLQRNQGLDDAAQLEVELQVGLAAHLVITRGNAAPEVECALTRARDLADGLGDERLRFRALRHLQTFHMVRGNLPMAFQISSELRGLALRDGDADLLLQVHRPHGLCLLYMGRFAEARDELLRALALYDPARHAEHRFQFGSDPAVLARAHLGWVEWFLGQPVAAQQFSREAVAGARTLDHAHSLCFALAFHACLAQFEGDVPEALAAANEMARVAQAHEYLYWSAWSQILLGWALMKSGDAKGLLNLHEGLADYSATGASLLRPYSLYLLADCVAATDRDGALDLLREALEEADARAVLYCRAEIVQLRDQLLRLGSG